MGDFSWFTSIDDIKLVLEKRFSKSHHGVSLVFNDQLDIGFGRSSDEIVEIGGKGCRSNDDYFSLIRSVFHEFRHVDQRRSNFMCCGKYASECRIEDIACQGSRSYYGAGLKPVKDIETGEMRFEYFREPWYFHNIREVDAEKHGVRDTYLFLLTNPSFYNGDLKGAYLGHINQYFHAPNKELCYFIDFEEPFDSLGDVDKCFDVALDDAVNYRRFDPVSRTGYSPYHDDSVVGAAMRLHDVGWSNTASRFVHAFSGVEERRIIAGVTRAFHPEYTRDLLYDDRKSISTWNTFRTLSLPRIPDGFKEKYDLLPDSERKAYYLDAVDCLSQFDVPDGSPGAGPETVPDFSENFP